MRYTWDEAKRQINLKKHGLDFACAASVFDLPMVLFEDVRATYGEQRMIGLGLLGDCVVVVVHVELGRDEIRIISMRKAERDETNVYYRNAMQF